MNVTTPDRKVNNRGASAPLIVIIIAIIALFTFGVIQGCAAQSGSSESSESSSSAASSESASESSSSSEDSESSSSASSSSSSSSSESSSAKSSSSSASSSTRTSSSAGENASTATAAQVRAATDLKSVAAKRTDDVRSLSDPYNQWIYDLGSRTAVMNDAEGTFYALAVHHYASNTAAMKFSYSEGLVSAPYINGVTKGLTFTANDINRLRNLPTGEKIYVNTLEQARNTMGKTVIETDEGDMIIADPTNSSIEDQVTYRPSLGGDLEWGRSIIDFFGPLQNSGWIKEKAKWYASEVDGHKSGWNRICLDAAGATVYNGDAFDTSMALSEWLSMAAWNEAYIERGSWVRKDEIVRPVNWQHAVATACEEVEENQLALFIPFYSKAQADKGNGGHGEPSYWLVLNPADLSLLGLYEQPEEAVYNPPVVYEEPSGDNPGGGDPDGPTPGPGPTPPPEEEDEKDPAVDPTHHSNDGEGGGVSTTPEAGKPGKPAVEESGDTVEDSQHQPVAKEKPDHTSDGGGTGETGESTAKDGEVIHNSDGSTDEGHKASDGTTDVTDHTDANGDKTYQDTADTNIIEAQPIDESVKDDKAGVEVDTSTDEWADFGENAGSASASANKTSASSSADDTSASASDDSSSNDGGSASASAQESVSASSSSDSGGDSGGDSGNDVASSQYQAKADSQGTGEVTNDADWSDFDDGVDAALASSSSSSKGGKKK